LRFGYDWENDFLPNEYPSWDDILERLLWKNISTV
jgi:hypothetical protein